jgi:carbonic anhydrase
LAHQPKPPIGEIVGGNGGSEFLLVDGLGGDLCGRGQEWCSIGSQHRRCHPRCDQALPIFSDAFLMPLLVKPKSIYKIAHGKLALETSPRDNIAYVSSAANLFEIATQIYLKLPTSRAKWLKERKMCKECQKNPFEPSAMSRRALGLLAISSAGLLLADKAAAKEKIPPKPQNVLSPDASLSRLLQGNARYVKGVALRHDFQHEREALWGGQNPYAAVLGCADSRIAPEYAFDSGRGDLFVCRVAGNFASDETIASLEYAVAVLATPLILVMGHDKCGAVDATIKSLKDDKPLPGHMPSLAAAIAPAVKAVLSKGDDILENAIRQNVVDNVGKLKSATPILSAAVEQNKLKVVGGIYRLKTGRVEILD